MDLHDRDVPRGPGVGVCGHHGHQFLQGQDILDRREIAEYVEKALLDRTGIAENVGYAIGNELLEHRAISGPHSVTPRYVRRTLASLRGATGYQPDRTSPFRNTSTNRSPNSCEHCRERAVMNG